MIEKNIKLECLKNRHIFIRGAFGFGRLRQFEVVHKVIHRICEQPENMAYSQLFRRHYLK